MWRIVEEALKSSPAKLKVARLLVEYGFRVSPEGDIYCGDVEIPDTKIAKAAGVDRRIVKETAKAILSDPRLREIFTKIEPAGALLKSIASLLGYGAVEIRADPQAVGVIARVANIIAGHGISIRQILAEDPELSPEPKLTVITSSPIPGEVVEELRKVPTVTQVTLY